MTLPWPHFYEYADSTVVIVHERQIMDDTGVLPLRFYKPDTVPLRQLSEMIHRAAAAPNEESSLHRKLIALAQLPMFIRRLIWGLCLNIPRLRRALGTYGVCSIARLEAELGISRCLLSYGPADPHGNVNVRLSFDHRIFDGALAGRALSRLDQVLNSSILEELREFARLEACTAHGHDVSSIPGHDARPCRPGD